MSEKVGIADAPPFRARDHTGTLEVKSFTNTGGPVSVGKKEKCTMRADVRRIIEMSKRVLSFSRAHPHPDEGYAVALARLEKAVAEADVLADRQEDGIKASRSVTGVKRGLRRKIRRTQLLHLSRVAESAATEAPELTEK